MRYRLLRQGFADRRHHADIFQHHCGIFAGRARRHDDERIIRAQLRRERLGGATIEKIDLLAAEPNDRSGRSGKLAENSATDKSARAKNYRSSG